MDNSVEFTDAQKKAIEKTISETVDKKVKEELKKQQDYKRRNEDPWITDFKDWLTNW